VKFLKIKTKQANVLKYGQKSGVTLEVEESTGKHLVARGVAEEVKAGKKNNKKQDTKEQAPEDNKEDTKEKESDK
jgi:hypothetical protein